MRPVETDVITLQKGIWGHERNTAHHKGDTDKEALLVPTVLIKENALECLILFHDLIKTFSHWYVLSHFVDVHIIYYVSKVNIS